MYHCNDALVLQASFESMDAKSKDPESKQVPGKNTTTGNAPATGTIPSKRDIEAAHERIKPYIHKTPVFTSLGIDEMIARYRAIGIPMDQ